MFKDNQSYTSPGHVAHAPHSIEKQGNKVHWPFVMHQTECFSDILIFSQMRTIIRLRQRNQITLPSEVLPAGLENSGLFEVFSKENGVIELRPIRLSTVGSEEAAQEETRAENDLKEGRFDTFGSVSDFSKALKDRVSADRGPDLVRHSQPVQGTVEDGRGDRQSRTTESAGKERVLVMAAQHGDREAFDMLVHHYDMSVNRLALHLTGSPVDAQDISQEAFLQAYRNIGSFQFESSFYTWLYRIVINLCLQRLRERPAKEEAKQFAVDVEHEVLGEEVLGPELSRRISEAMRKLTPHERMIFELKHYQGLRLSTIASILDIAEDAVRHALSRATQHLRGAVSAR